MRVDISRLPYIDEHSVDLGLGADDAWPFLVDGIERSFSHRAANLYARLLRCDDTEVTGPRPFAVGSTVPGFHVESLALRSTLVCSPAGEALPATAASFTEDCRPRLSIA